MSGLLVRAGWTPLRWQDEALEATRVALIDPTGPQWQSGVVVAATGCGKATFLAGLSVQHALRGGRVVIVVDRENLVLGLHADVCAVAKDNGLVGRVSDLEAGRFTPAMVGGSGYPLVGMSMAERNELAHPIVVASIQSLSQPGRLAAMGWASLLITDEAHGATAPTHRALHARLGELYPKWKHVGMTATAYRGDGSEGLGAVFDGEIYRFGMPEAIAAGVLVPIEAWGVKTEVSIESVGVGKDGEFAEAEIEDKINNDDRNALAWDAYLEHCPGKPALFFALNVKHAHDLARMGREKYRINAQPVHGPNKAFPLKESECRARIKAYKETPEKLPVLVSCDLIRVGFDAPKTVGVVLCRPWRSKVAFVQTVGRGTRTVGIPASVHDPAERRRLIAASSKPKMVFIQLVDQGCSLTLDQETNLTTDEGPEANPLDVGDDVERRRHPEWGIGVIGRVLPEVGRLGREVEVAWPVTPTHPAGAVRVHPCRDLKRPKLLPKPEDAPKPEPAVVSVQGHGSYRIHLLPGETIEDPGTIAWYEYQDTYTVAATADRVGRVLMHARKGAKGWELWSLRGPIAAKAENTDVEWIPTLRRGDCSTPALAIAEGNSHLRANRATVVPVLAEWKGADATPGQKGLARKWGVKRDLDGVTMGECSALIDAAMAKRTVDDHLDPGLAHRRAFIQKRVRS